MDYKLVKIQLLILRMSKVNPTINDLNSRLKELGY